MFTLTFFLALLIGFFTVDCIKGNLSKVFLFLWYFVHSLLSLSELLALVISLPNLFSTMDISQFEIIAIISFLVLASIWIASVIYYFYYLFVINKKGLYSDRKNRSFKLYKRHTLR